MPITTTASEEDGFIGVTGITRDIPRYVPDNPHADEHIRHIQELYQSVIMGVTDDEGITRVLLGAIDQQDLDELSYLYRSQDNSEVDTGLKEIASEYTEDLNL